MDGIGDGRHSMSKVTDWRPTEATDEGMQFNSAGACCDSSRRYTTNYFGAAEIVFLFVS